MLLQTLFFLKLFKTFSHNYRNFFRNFQRCFFKFKNILNELLYLLIKLLITKEFYLIFDRNFVLEN